MILGVQNEEASATNGLTTRNPETDQQCIVKYRHEYYDIAKFMQKHPGGINTLKGLNNANMTERFMKAPPHSDAAIYLMKEYKIGNTHSRNNSTYKKVNEENGNNNGVEPLNSFNRNNPEIEDTNNNELKEYMEHLVDWNKPMLAQISTITRFYNEWVHKPVDRPLRLFGPAYLEILTKTPWWLVPTFWIPVILKSLEREVLSSWHTQTNFQLIFFISYFVAGILFWTLLEYTLHRWVFHMKIDNEAGPWLCTFHFVIHGLHHKVPFDPMRLVFPPLPGAILASIIYMPLSFVVPHPRVILAGALFGYLCYDLMHYYLHYGNPTIQHMYHMKRYHFQHHFAHQDLGYGISSPMWDVVFKTQIHLRKLKFRLRWK